MNRERSERNPIGRCKLKGFTERIELYQMHRLRAIVSNGSNSASVRNLNRPLPYEQETDQGQTIGGSLNNLAKPKLTSLS
jgi:hypothetical protein